VVKFLVGLVLVLSPALAQAGDATPIEVLQREAVEQATPEQGPKPASSVFSDISLGRAGHASWSLLIPGWAQYRAGNNGRAFLFASAEVAIWSVFAASKWQQSSREDTYRSFARNFAGVHGTDYDDDYWSAVGKYLDSDEFNESVRRENRAAAEEQAINGEPVTIGINDGTVSSNDAWMWTSVSRRVEYRELRSDAQAASDRADAMIFFAVINRVVAFIEAFRSGPGSDGDSDVELYRVGEFELSVELDPNPFRPSGAVQLGRSF
jgi:hypothetical protein